jgi:hypothetical protein
MFTTLAEQQGWGDRTKSRVFSCAHDVSATRSSIGFRVGPAVNPANGHRDRDELGAVALKRVVERRAPAERRIAFARQSTAKARGSFHEGAWIGARRRGHRRIDAQPSRLPRKLAEPLTALGALTLCVAGHQTSASVNGEVRLASEPVHRARRAVLNRGWGRAHRGRRTGWTHVHTFPHALTADARDRDRRLTVAIGVQRVRQTFEPLGRAGKTRIHCGGRRTSGACFLAGSRVAAERRIGRDANVKVRRRIGAWARLRLGGRCGLQQRTSSAAIDESHRSDWADEGKGERTSTQDADHRGTRRAMSRPALLFAAIRGRRGAALVPDRADRVIGVRPEPTRVSGRPGTCLAIGRGRRTLRRFEPRRYPARHEHARKHRA